MNNWHGNIAMGQMQSQMMQNMMGGSGSGGPGVAPPLPPGMRPLMPPDFMLPNININSAPLVDPPKALIGPVMPDNMTTEDMAMSDEEKQQTPAKDITGKDDSKKDSKDSNARDRDSRRDNRDRDRGRNDSRGGPRDRDRGRYDRRDRSSDKDRSNDRNRDRFSGRNNDRSDRSRDKDRRERRTKWGDEKDIDVSGGGGLGSGIMMPGIGMGPGGQMSMGLGGQGMGMGPGGHGMGMSMGTGHMMGGMGQNNQGMGGMGPGDQSMSGMGPGAPAMGGMGSGGPGMGGMGPGGTAMGGMGPGQGMGQGMVNTYGMQNTMPMMNNMMMNNMMDPNVIMINRQMLLPNQPIYVADITLLPPIPGNSMPNRREKPPGCRTIFVGGLPMTVSEDVIAEIFQSFGVVTDIKVHRRGVCHVRFDKQESVEASFILSGYRYKEADQTKNEATTLFIDYALNREDQNEFERSQRVRQKTPPRIEPFNPNTLSAIGEKIKSDDNFLEAAPTLVVWLERGECTKRNANMFYSLIQASNNQVRRLFNEKMALDEEFHNMKASLREKFSKVVDQFEQVAKILAVARHQRVSDHFTKQQRRNIEMWLKMTEEVENIKEEYNATFDEEETERPGRNVVPAEKYEQLRMEHENLIYELEGYKNEAHLAKDEAERKFEKFKAHYIAQQALQGKGQSQVFPPLPPPPVPNIASVPPMTLYKPQPPPPTPDDDKFQTSGPAIPPTEAKLIAILTAFLMVHPLGASLDYLVSYVRSMVPNVTQATVRLILQKHVDVFTKKTSGIGANIEHRWGFVTFDAIKSEAH